MRSKLGLWLPPGLNPTISNGAVAAIAATDSILIEQYFRWISPHHDGSSNFWFQMGTGNNNIYVWCQNSTKTLYAVYQDGGGFDWAQTIPYPKNNTIFYLAILLDKTNSLKEIYVNGQLARSQAVGAVNPDMSGGVVNVNLNSASAVPILADTILTRVTALTSCPATKTAAIKRMWNFPMILDADFEAVKSNLASQYDLEDQIVDDGGHSYRTIEDHGSTGGNDLISSVDLENLITIAEKCNALRPDKTYYVGNAQSMAYNEGINGHGIQSGAFLVQVMFPIGEKYQHHMLNVPFLIADSTMQHRIHAYTTAGWNRYAIAVFDASGSREYEIHPNLYSVSQFLIAIEGATTKVYADGNLIALDASGKTPVYTGLPLWITQGGWRIGMTGFKSTYHVPLIRLWNYPGGSLPSGWEDEARKMVRNPWPRSVVYGDANLFMEYLWNSDVPDASAVIPNSANPGVGDLTIEPAGTFINARKEWRK